MFSFRELKKSFRILLIHRLRTFLSTLGILFGVVAVIAMLSIGEGAKQETLDQIEQLGVNNIMIRQPSMSEEQQVLALEQGSKGLTLRDIDVIRHNISSVIFIAPLKKVAASITGALKEMSPEIIAITRHYGEIKKMQTTEGRFLCDLDQQKKRLVCVLGYDVAKSLGQGGHVGQSLRIENVEYEIVGVLKAMQWKANKIQAIASQNFDKTILIPIGSEINLPRSLTNHSLSEIILQIKNSKQLDHTVRQIKHILKRLHEGFEDYQIIIPRELLQQANRTQRTFNWVLGSIAAISLFVGGIGIMNIMLATVSERTREIGIRRAVGANKQHILLQFLLEALILTLGGAILGVTIGIFCSIAINSIAGWRTIVTSWSIVIALIMSAAVGLCSGIYPAFQAAKMDPIKALRYD